MFIVTFTKIKRKIKEHKKFILHFSIIFIIVSFLIYGLHEIIGEDLFSIIGFSSFEKIMITIITLELDIALTIEILFVFYLKAHYRKKWHM